MGLRKPQDYSEKEISTALFGRAIAHPVRVKIINLLHKNRLTLKDIGKTVNLSPTAVRNHIQILQDARLLSVEYKVHFLLYTLNSENYRQSFTDFLDTQTNDGKPQRNPEHPKSSALRLIPVIIGFVSLVSLNRSSDRTKVSIVNKPNSGLTYNSG